MFLCGIGIIPGFIYGEHVSFFEKDEKFSWNDNKSRKGLLQKNSRMQILLLLFFIAAFIGNIDYITVVILLCGIGIIPGFIYGEHVSFF